MAAGRAQGFTTAVTDIDVSAQEYLGMIRYDYNRAYRYVMFTGTTLVNVGDVVCYVLTDNNLNTVDGANTAIGAGVAPVVHPLGSVSYGWVQIRGPATLSQAVPGAAGGSLTTVGAAAPALAVAAAVTNAIVAVAINTAARVVYALFPD